MADALSFRAQRERATSKAERDEAEKSLVRVYDAADVIRGHIKRMQELYRDRLEGKRVR